MKSYVYILVRLDIPLEQQLVQVGHAAWEAGQVFKGPVGETCSIALLSVPNRAALEAAANRLESYGIDHKMFFEPDFQMGNSAIATRPVSEKKERYLFKKYPAYKASAYFAKALSLETVQPELEEVGA